MSFDKSNIEPTYVDDNDDDNLLIFPKMRLFRVNYMNTDLNNITKVIT